MSYTVICSSGKVMCFYLKSVAEMYAVIHRGVLVSPEVLDVEPFTNIQ